MIERSLLKLFFKPASKLRVWPPSDGLRSVAKVMLNSFALCAIRGPIEPSILRDLPNATPNFLFLCEGF